MLQTEIADVLKRLAEHRLLQGTDAEEKLRVAELIIRRRAERDGDQVCVKCGCCEWAACVETMHGNCSWAAPGLCSLCAEKQQARGEAAA